MKPHESTYQRRTDFVLLDTRSCDACWDCLEVCPEQVFGKIDMIWHRHAIIRNAEACNGCKKCVRTCESQALEYIYLPEPRADRSASQRLASAGSLSAYNKNK